MRLLRFRFEHLLVALAILWAVADASAQVQSPCLRVGSGSAICVSSGSPESVVYGNKGDVDMDSTNGTIYVKTANSSNTGWAVLTTGAATGASAAEAFVTIGNTSGLSAERALTGTSNQIVVTDNGANSTVVLSTPQNIHTTATPQFSRIGLGQAADSVLALFSDASGGAIGCELFDDGNSSTALTVNLDTKCNTHLITLTGSPTLTFSNPKDGVRYLFIIDTGAGSFNVTWPGNVNWSGGTGPTITSAANKVDLVSCIYRGTGVTSYYCTFIQNFSH